MALQPDTKLAAVRDAMAKRDWDTALHLAAKFPTLGEHGNAIRTASTALKNPIFYHQLGKDIDELRRAGIKAMKERFSKSWDEVESTRRETEQP